jgi:hypothetical protein
MSLMQYQGVKTYKGSKVPNSLELFINYCTTIELPRVLELGVYQSMPGRSTMHKTWVPHATVFHGTDIEAGEDVDFVADVHKLSEVCGEKSYDVIISCSTFEHFKYPHIAALEISKVLSDKGAIFIQTHSTFPIHAYPYDYFRFTEEALSGCFGTLNGIQVKNTDYTFPATISSAADGGPHPAWLNVNLFGIKTHETPKDYLYELDTEL